MHRRIPGSLFIGAALAASLFGCGARSSLISEDRGSGGSGGAGGSAGPCSEGVVEACGSDQGVCKKGKHTCHAGVLGPCEGAIGPSAEVCNGLDDDCNGQIDEPFGVGQACDGPDTDVCLDDVKSCEGCSKGPDNVEVCNGVDDNCNGVVDADCETGDCKPTLVVVGSTPSSPNCIDFPVQAGSTGVIEFPCAGGPVTAQLGDISFSGAVQNGFASLDGTALVMGPDGCTWKTSHHIEGQLSSGMMSYSYQEEPIAGVNCWQPCTESGEVQIQWAPIP